MYPSTHTPSPTESQPTAAGIRHTLLRIAVLAATLGCGLGYAVVETAPRIRL